MSTWSDVPYLFVPMVSCPFCRSTRPITIRSEQAGDGSTSRRCICRKCSRRFVVVLEPPERDTLPDSGNEQGFIRYIPHQEHKP